MSVSARACCLKQGEGFHRDEKRCPVVSAKVEESVAERGHAGLFACIQSNDALRR
jgi:hypothetical protein